MKKLLSLFTAGILAAVLLILPGCGSTTTEPQSAAEPGGDVYNGETVEITVCDRIINVTGTDRFRYLRQKQFEEDYPNIKVNHISMVAGDTTNMVEYLTTVFMGSNAPSMMSVSSISYIRDLYNAGLAADIRGYIADDSDFYKAYDYVQDAFHYGDAVIGFPESLEVPLMGYFNDALSAAGYDPATFTCDTWDEYYEVAKRLDTDSYAGSSLYVYEYYLWPNNWFLSNGAEPAVQNEDGTITLDFANERMLETLNFFRRLYQDGLTNSNINYTSIEDMLNLIYNKKVASFTLYPNWLSRLLPYDIQPDDITLTPYPTGPSGESKSSVIVAGTVFNAQKSPEELKAAVVYAEYMADESFYTDLAAFRDENEIVEFSIPPYASVDWSAGMKENGIPDSWIDSTKNALENGFVTPLHSTAFTTYLTTQFAGLIRDPQADIAAVLTEAQETATREWLEDFNTYLN